jgi:hypothetical protein
VVRVVRVVMRVVGVRGGIVVRVEVGVGVEEDRHGMEGMLHVQVGAMHGMAPPAAAAPPPAPPPAPAAAPAPAALGAAGAGSAAARAAAAAGVAGARGAAR